MTEKMKHISPLQTCDWTKADFMEKQLSIVNKHIRHCRDCKSTGHLFFHSRNKSHPLGSINVRARQYRVWYD